MTINIEQYALQELQRENEMLHAENAFKLTQILDLEQILYNTRQRDLEDKSPCWCDGFQQILFYGTGKHNESCTKARQATEPFWKK